MTNYTHPNCGDLTDAEREAILFIPYRQPDKVHLFVYLRKFFPLNVRDCERTLYNLMTRDLVWRDGMQHRLTLHGEAIWNKLEAGGW